MSGLQGDFVVFPPRSLLLHCAARRVSGQLVCARGAVRRRFVLDAGDAITASSTEPREYLGQYLINLGLLDEESLTRAFHFQEETGTPLGWVLSKSGLVPEVAVRRALFQKIKESLLDVLLWEQGHFELTPEVPKGPQGGLETRVAVTDALVEADQREAVWATLRQAFPSGQQRLAVDEEAVAMAQDGFDQRIVDVCRTRPSVDELVLLMRAPDFQVYTRLLALRRAGAVKVADAEPGRPEEGGTLSAILAQARSDFAGGRYDEAAALAEKAAEMAPESEETAELAFQSEALLLDLLRAELTVATALPELVTDRAALKGLALSAPERYLLSRVDGKHDVPSILKSSPLRELDGLRAFRRFVRERIVRMVPAEEVAL